MKQAPVHKLRPGDHVMIPSLARCARGGTLWQRAEFVAFDPADAGRAEVVALGGLKIYRKSVPVETIRRCW